MWKDPELSCLRSPRCINTCSYNIRLVPGRTSKWRYMLMYARHAIDQRIKKTIGPYARLQLEPITQNQSICIWQTLMVTANLRIHPTPSPHWDNQVHVLHHMSATSTFIRTGSRRHWRCGLLPERHQDMCDIRLQEVCLWYPGNKTPKL